MPQQRNTNISELKRQANALRKKLVKLRADLDVQPLVEEYDNGGGQIGTHANPWVVEYQRMLKTYQGLVRDIAAYDQTAGKASGGQASPLILMRGKFDQKRKAEKKGDHVQCG